MTSEQNSWAIPLGNWRKSYGSWAVGLVALCLSSRAFATPLERDLGEGLHYVRLHHVPEDLPAKGVGKSPTTLDLRFVEGDAAAGTALQAWIRFNASPKTPLFILANSETSAALLGALRGKSANRAWVIVGSTASDFQPDVSVTTTTAEERRAYDALENGADIASLVIEATDKSRNDEARLAHEHLPDSALSDEPIAATPPSARPPQLIDAALQRAVQVHRALLALHKISG